MNDNIPNRREIGVAIDPLTATVMWRHGQILDPYGDNRDLPLEAQCIGRLYFARSPELDSIWVEFGDLPETTRSALQSRIEANDPTVWEPDLLPFE